MRKWIFISIFILTVADAIFTALGVRSGYIEEANPLLQKLFESSPEFASVLIALISTALLILIYKYQNRIRWIDTVLVLMFLIKLGVLGLHFRWIIFYI
jgi:hypothetical protein